MHTMPKLGYADTPSIIIVAVSTEPVPVPNVTALKSRERHVMQSSEWENNFPAVLPTFSRHPRPKTFWLNPKDRRPDA